MSASFQHEFYSLFIYPHIWLTNDDALLPLLRATRDRETRWEFKVTYCYSTFCQGQIADIHKKDNYLFSIDLKLFFFFFFLKKEKLIMRVKILCILNIYQLIHYRYSIMIYYKSNSNLKVTSFFDDTNKIF